MTEQAVHEQTTKPAAPKTFNEFEMALAATSMPVKATTERKEGLTTNQALAYIAHKRGYSHDHIAKALKAPKANVGQWIRQAQNALALVDKINGYTKGR